MGSAMDQFNELVENIFTQYADNPQGGIDVMDQMAQTLPINQKVFWFVSLATKLFRNNDFQTSIIAWNKALKYSIKAKDKATEVQCYANISISLYQVNNYDESIYYAQKALATNSVLHDPKIELACNKTMGCINEKRNDFNKAILYFEAALKNSVQLFDKHEEAKCYLSLGDDHIQKFIRCFSTENQLLHKEDLSIDLTKAEEYLNKAISISVAIGAQDIKEKAFRSLAHIPNIEIPR